jgi:uncharacterized membrane protein YkvI
MCYLLFTGVVLPGFVGCLLRVGAALMILAYALCWFGPCVLATRVFSLLSCFKFLLIIPCFITVHC